MNNAQNSIGRSADSMLALAPTSSHADNVGAAFGAGTGLLRGGPALDNVRGLWSPGAAVGVDRCGVPFHCPLKEGYGARLALEVGVRPGSCASGFDQCCRF